MTSMAAKGPASLVPRHPTAQRLLDAAIRSMDAEGEAGLRVDAVVAEAGVTIPVLYHHFGNREGLVQAAHVARLARTMDETLDAFARAIDEVDDRAGMVAVFDWILEVVSAPSLDRAIRANVLGATYGRPDLQEEVARLQRSAWKRTAALLEAPQRQGWLRADLDLELCVGWLFGLFFGRSLLDIQGDAVDPAPWDRYTREAVYVVLFGELPPA